jgi:hypothetical protein
MVWPASSKMGLLVLVFIKMAVFEAALEVPVVKGLG